MIKNLLIIFVILLVVSCGNTGKTELELSFDKLGKDRDAARVEFTKRLEMVYKGIPRQKEIKQLYKKEDELRKLGKRFSDEDMKRLQYLLEERKSESKLIISSSASFMKANIKLIALTSNSFNECGSTEVEIIAIDSFKKMEKNIQHMSINTLDFYNRSKAEYNGKFNSYDYSNDCKWLNKRKNELLDGFNKMLEIIK